MKSLLLLFLLSASTAIAQKGIPYQSEQFPVSGSTKLTVITSGGHIDVVNGASDHVLVEMFVHKNGKYYDAGSADLSDYSITLRANGSEIIAEAIRNSKVNVGFGFGSSNYGISFKITTPEQTSADLKTSGGHITITGIEGNLDGKTSGGHITLENVKGKMDMYTSGGHITIDQIYGPTTVKTSGGNIKAANVYGDFNASTSGGNMTLHDISGSISASTSGGSITANLINTNKDVQLSTSGGNVTIQVPENAAFDISAKASVVRHTLNGFEGTNTKGSLSGTLNGGGPKLTAKSGGGSITLRPR